jgi:hypothetical protein
MNVQQIQQLSKIPYVSHLPPELNVKLYSILDLANIDINTSDILTRLNKVKTEKEIVTLVSKYIIDNRLYNLSFGWYKHIKSTITQFAQRYNTHGFIADTLPIYRDLFRLYLQLSIDYNIYNAADHRELDYFIGAQFASRCSYKDGLLTKIEPRTFVFSSNMDHYYNLKSKGYHATLVHDPIYLFLQPPYAKVNKKFIYRNKLLSPDTSLSIFIDVELPVLVMALPNLKKRSKEWLATYLYNLEVLIYRCYLLNKLHNKFLLAIEHYRAYSYYKVLNV